ncbi:hypothetical protein QAD02_006266 [Eretmocerus hayati]|uniref:Uncharacterized protein n=1 Tax=Eretmocerus hayati TaxID=131215 RepID=A0ACC2N0T4_9HYME|nr:hypothetical protein QAD02_006266 [Eretmocerus hayati]
MLADSKKVMAAVGVRERHEFSDIGMEKSPSMDDFPWVTEFRQLCRNSITWKGCPSSSNLLRFLIRHVSSDISDCLKKSLKAVKLKDLIREALPLLIIFRRCEQIKEQNRAAYLERMSDLLAMYIDLELVSSKRDAEPQPGRISARLVSSLCVCLENSTEHLLDTLIKVRLMKETHTCILDPIISKILKIIPDHPSNEGLYVRYLLVYRLWRRIHSNLAAKEQINANAVKALGQMPKNLPNYVLENVLPPARSSSASTTNPSSPSSSRSLHDTLTTKYCLYQQFDLRKACVHFMKFCARRCDDEENAIPETSREHRLKNEFTSTTNEVESNSISSIPSSVFKSNNTISRVRNIPSLSLANDSSNEKTSSSDNATKKSLVTSALVRKEKKSKHLDDVVLIDLTDEEATKVIRRQKPRKIGWLEDARRSINAKLKEAATLKKDREQTSQTTPKIPEEKQHPEDAMRRLTIQTESSNVSLSPTETSSNKKAEPTIKDTRPVNVGTPPVTQPRRPPSITKPLQDKVPRINVHVELEKLASTEMSSSGACSVIRRSGPSESFSPVILNKSSVNSSTTKTDVTMSEPTVQEATSNDNQESHVEVRNMYSNVNSETIEPVTKESYYDLPESDIDGLTLLASVSAQQRVSTSSSSSSSSKKPELKVKPYTCLQERQPVKDASPADDSEAINRIIGIHPEDSSEKIFSQVDAGVKQPQVVSSYVASTVEVMQNGLESNDNSNVIMNGETVMLMKKSPYSNLYIINKAAVDDEELAEPLDTKPNLLVKHEQTLIKPDPDEAKLFDIHYPSYPTPAYCPHPPPPTHHSSTGCACVSCAYCRPPPYYSIAPIGAQPDDSVVSRLKQFDSKLPLKKRLTAQRSVDLSTQNEPCYPATLMMSIADVELKPSSGVVESPLNLGATVEVTSSLEPKQPRSRRNQNTAPKSRKRKTAVEVNEKEDKESKKPRKRASRKTTIVSAGQACAELDPEWNPSGRRKRKRSGR